MLTVSSRCRAAAFDEEWRFYIGGFQFLSGVALVP